MFCASGTRGSGGSDRNVGNGGGSVNDGRLGRLACCVYASTFLTWRGARGCEDEECEDECVTNDEIEHTHGR